jgi:hypothetical protein
MVMENLMENVNLCTVEPQLIEDAKESLAQNDILGAMACMPYSRQLAFVCDNYPPLRKAGVYEKALLNAYTGIRTNLSEWSPGVINFLFGLADRKKLIEAGDPLPGEGPFTIYRGVGGRGAARRIRGISWTASLERAIWFAKRFNLEKPAVFEATVDKSLVLAYYDGRKESEFLCDIPRGLKVKKVWPKRDRKNALPGLSSEQSLCSC